MKDFIIWIKENNFVRYKDDTWYIPGKYPNTKYYTEDQLIELYESIDI